MGESQGAAFIVVIAPNSHSIYPEHLPGYVNRVWPETRLDQVVRRLQERGSSLIVVDPRRDLWAAKQQALLYHKYEDHWNSLGAFVAYSASLRAIKRRVPAVEPLQFSDYTITQGHRVWHIPPRKEADPVFALKLPTRIVSSRSLDNTNPLHPIVETTTHLEKAPTALVHGDSFGDAMLPFFNETFRRTVFVPTGAASFPTELIRQQKPDVVILEMVERSLSLRPPASEALENEDLVRGAPSLDDVMARSSGIGGYINGAGETAGRIEFMGWAVDQVANAPARLVLAYYDTRPVGAARMWYLRPDIASMNGQKVGFRLSIPSDPGLNDPARLRFFSINVGGRIYEIALTPTLRRHLGEILARR